MPKPRDAGEPIARLGYVVDRKTAAPRDHRPSRLSQPVCRLRALLPHRWGLQDRRQDDGFAPFVCMAYATAVARSTAGGVGGDLLSTGNAARASQFSARRCKARRWISPPVAFELDYLIHVPSEYHVAPIA